MLVARLRRIPDAAATADQLLARFDLTDAATAVDGVSGFSYPLVFLPFISSAFVPTAGMPGPVRWFAEHQPVTPIVDTLRALLAEQPVGLGIWTALAWCVGLLVVAYVLAMRVHRSRTS